MQSLECLMAGKRAVMDHESVSPRFPICCYESFFLSSSITIMATDCRFFPSQLVGETSAGSGNHKKISSLPYNPLRLNRAIDRYFGGDFASAPHLLNADLLFSAKAGFQPPQRTCVLHTPVL